MILLGDGAVVYSASDLAVAAACEYALIRRLDVKLGRSEPLEPAGDAMLERAARLGEAHEARVLDEYRERFGRWNRTAGTGVMEIERPAYATHESPRPSATRRSRRCAPAFASKVSRLAYEDRLASMPCTEERSLDGIAPGVRTVLVAHGGNAVVSTEEADVVIVSLAASSADDVPRGMEVLFDRSQPDERGGLTRSVVRRRRPQPGADRLPADHARAS